MNMLHESIKSVSDVELIACWKNRIDMLLAFPSLINEHASIHYRPDRLASDAMMRISTKFLYVALQVEKAIGICDKSRDDLELGDPSAGYRLAHGLDSLNMRLGSVIKILEAESDKLKMASDDRRRRIEDSISKLGAGIKPDIIIKTAKVNRQEGRAILRQLEKEGLYQGFAH